ncbi:MAG: radical SAM protein [Euryarchaeota archaeon]|jgi:biotin synthase|nr:radical SAM protein [Euryarchaeota archaeon]MBT7432345.1 radical SAM protein [Euryarchaeota archaeon]|tara:strand:- start:3863 stop:4999 length:1137 start_codon:yes stop_codon:yes gene_type:complete
MVAGKRLKIVDATPDMVRDTVQEVRTSQAAALIMGTENGRFYRDAKLHSINVLLDYEDGCHAKCGYCGLAKSRESEEDWTDRSFIRVDWPLVSLDQVNETISSGTAPDIERVCVSMVLNRGAKEDTIDAVRKLSESITRISILLMPTVIDKEWLIRAKEAGADMVATALDGATRKVFDAVRGKDVKGPLDWDNYWQCVEDTIEVFGPRNAGIHLVAGLGETEKEIVETMQRAHDMGALTHLFSFNPEPGTTLGHWPQPPIGSYRRVQLARYIINENFGRGDAMTFDKNSNITDFGLDAAVVEMITEGGKAFMTSGCAGETVDCACNRPFGNCTPGEAAQGRWRNFPIPPISSDIVHAKRQLKDYDGTEDVEVDPFDDD